MTVAHLNRIATAVPEFDVHEKFVAYAPELLSDERSRRLFRRTCSSSTGSGCGRESSVP